MIRKLLKPHSHIRLCVDRLGSCQEFVSHEEWRIVLFVSVIVGVLLFKGSNSLKEAT